MPLQAICPNDERRSVSAPSSTPPHEMASLRTPEQVRSHFIQSGQSIADWARSRGFSVELTRMVAAGQRKCLRGQSHQIAVALGMK